MGKWTFLKKGDFLVRKIPRGPKWEPSEEVRRVLEAEDRKSTRLNSSHIQKSRMPSSA